MHGRYDNFQQDAATFCFWSNEVVSIEQMFDTGLMAIAGLQLDPELLAKIQPVNLSLDRLLEVPGPLESLFPAGGIERGWSVGIEGVGSWGVAMALLASGLGAEGWVAVVGLPTFNLVAAASYGVRLDRVILVDEPGPGRWATVIATLLEAVDVVVVASPSPVGARDARRLTGRAREQESVLFHLDGAKSWPTAANMSLATTVREWQGLGMGHGHLQARKVSIEATGRRGGAKPTSVDVWLPDADGKLALAAPASFRPRLVTADSL